MTAEQRQRMLARKRELHHSDRSRDTQLRYKYGISLIDYNEMLAAQAGVCAICHQAPPRKRLAVDHCHETKRVRGLLCEACNKAIGLLADDPDRLRSAADYLARAA